jgi:type IV pilus assembly protein PilA
VLQKVVRQLARENDEQRSRRHRQAGFTLMELLIVISIMLVLMLIAIPNFAKMRIQANQTSAILSLRSIYSAQIQ